MLLPADKPGTLNSNGKAPRLRIVMSSDAAVAGAGLPGRSSTVPRSSDWPDWWSDGLASEPVATRLFRQAQRDWLWLRALLARHPELPRPDLTALEDQLGLFAEHVRGLVVSGACAQGEDLNTGYSRVLIIQILTLRLGDIGNRTDDQRRRDRQLCDECQRTEEPTGGPGADREQLVQTILRARLRPKVHGE